MTRPTRTDVQAPMTYLAEALLFGPSEAIERQETRGGEEMVLSDVLPIDTFGTDDEFLALGFEFGEPLSTDPIFRSARLPDGWTRSGSGHSMWTKILDDRGIERAAIFYKAAFYDRSSHMRVSNAGYQVASGILEATNPQYDGKDLDVVWSTSLVHKLTLAELDDAVQAVIQRRDSIKQYPYIWDKTGEHAAIVDEILERLCDRVTVVV